MKKSILITSLLGLTFLLTACASQPSLKATKVKVVEAGKVKKCRFLGQVSGSAVHEGFGVFQGELKAKNDALDVAADLGATHLVWVETSGGLSPKARGKAYRCREGLSSLIVPLKKTLHSGQGRPSPREVKAWLSRVRTGFNIED